MWMSYAMLSVKFGCSQDTIRRRVKEMERSGMFPTAVRRICGVEVDDVQLERFCTMGRRRSGDGEDEE